MKIAVYSPTFFPVIDGTSIQAKRQVELISQGYNVKGITFSIDRDIKYSKNLQKLDDGIKRVKPKYIDNQKFPSLSGEAIVSELDKFAPDIIHIRGWYQFNAINDILDNSYKKNLKVFWHADGLHECHEKFREDEFYKKVVKKAVDYKTIFIGNSSYDLEILLKIGVDKKNFRPVPPILGKNMNTNEKDWSNPKILSLARFFNYKKHEDVFEVAKSIDKNLEVILVGASDSKDAEKIIKNLNKQNAILVLDPSDVLVNDLYNSATHFVLASDRETLGISVLESISFGCIPLVKRNKGIVSYVSEEFIFDDNITMREKLSSAIKPEKAKELDCKLKDVREKLSLEKIKSEFVKIYQEVL
jgi:glycosyltransferase involved in cell wall biosynthesis